MQLIFDHIASILIFGSVIILLMTTQIRAQQSATEQTIAYMARKQSLNMAEMFEQEIAQLGIGTADQIESITTNDAGETTSFVFWRDDDDGTDLEIEYRLEESKTVEVDGDDVQLYSFVRYEDGEELGGGSHSIRNLRIEPLTAGGNVTTPANARLIRITMVNAYPMGDLDELYLFQSYWGITLHPAGLD